MNQHMTIIEGPLAKTLSNTGADHQKPTIIN